MTKLIAGPDGDQFSALEQDMFGSLTALQDHGDAVQVEIAGVTTVVLYDLNLIHRVFADKLDHVGMPPPLERLSVATRSGILTNYDWDTWRPRRRAIIKPLGARAVGRFHDRMKTIIADELATWPTDEVFDIGPRVRNLTLRVVADLLFSEDLDEEAIRVVDAVTTEIHAWAEDDPSNTNITDPPPSFTAAIADLDNLIRSIIASRDATAPGTDMVGLLIEAIDDQNVPIDAEGVRDEALTLILAGHETVTATLSFALDAIGRWPDQRLSDPRHIVDETLRLFPPVHVTAKLITKDFDLGPFTIPKGWEVLIPEYVISRTEAHFERADEFIAERWSDESKLKMERRAYFPFLTGPKFCVGSHFALLEASEAIEQFMKLYEHEMINPQIPWGREFALTFAPAEPQPCRLTSR